MTKLVAVVPTYNEASGLPRLAERLLQLELAGIDLSMLVVDDGSQDGTASLADELARRRPERVEVLHRRGERGLGSAYIQGFSHALAGGAELVAQMDADLSHDPEALQSFVDAIANAELVIGSRYLAGGSVDTDWGWHRKFLSWAANRVVVPLVLSLPLTDATSGFRLWRRDLLTGILQSLRVRSHGYGFQVEMAYLAHRLGSTINEVPIYFRERDAGKSKMTLEVKLAAVREILSIRAQHRRD